MGRPAFSRDDYAARVDYRISTGTPVFAYDADVKAGKASGVHKSLDPKGVKIRESRDSDEHPVTVPVAVIMDTTGSMQSVPRILEDRLCYLMGHFLDDKASGKKYLGDGYPAILIGAIDDYDAQKAHHHSGEGSLQFGQFESGLEIDQMLENLWLTGNGGGTYEESYQLALYMMARHTAHDHWEKRGRKGYLFLIGDEHPYPRVDKKEVHDVIGDDLQDHISLADILTEVQERYHVFFILPNLTNHYSDNNLFKYWSDLLGQQNALRLQDPNKICELIVATTAICEEHAGVDDLITDGIADEDMRKALVPLAKAAGEVTRYSAAGLEPLVAGSGAERI